MIKSNLISNLEGMQVKEIFGELHWYDCHYGCPDGPDDYIKECDCYDDEKWGKLLQSINEIWR